MINFQNQILAINPEHLGSLKSLCEIVNKNAANEIKSELISSGFNRLDSVLKIVNDTAVIDIKGVITKGIPPWMLLFGFCDLDDIDAALRVSLGNPSVKTIILNIDSEGGAVIGVSEVASLVNFATTQKQVLSYTSGLMCSAAYWIASQSDFVTATETSVIGSIGTILTRWDVTGELAQDGVVANVIRAGKYKGMGDPNLAFSEEELAVYLERINYINGKFTDSVSSKRGVPQEAMEGQWFFGGQGLENKLVDMVTEMTLDDFVSSVLLQN